MESLIYILNVIAALIIIPLTTWLKMKLPDLSFLPPLVALGLATIFAVGIDWVGGFHLDTKTLLMIIFGSQFVAQLGYEGKKMVNGG